MRKWWETGVVYQIYPRSFRDTDGDGIGNLAGVTEKLDYLSTTLGVDAIWLSPFYPSPQKDFGYDVADYTDVEPDYGTLDDFDDMLTEAHARGLKVIVDIVPNHSSDLHEWFLESRSSRDNPKRDWYVWRDAKPDGSSPNNWLSAFAGSAWEWDEASGQYYLHSFAKEQPDLNWRNPEVRRAMADVFRFWLDRGVDGFRIDVAHFIAKDPEFRDNPMKDGPVESTDYKPVREFDRQHHVHNFAHADVHRYYQEIRQVVDEYEDRFTIGEIHEYDWDKWASYYGDGSELHMPYNFALLPAGWDAARIRDVVASVEAAVPSFGWPNYVWGNHDEVRIATRLGDRQARAATVLLLTLRGTPTVYYGDELGIRQYVPPVGQELDPAAYEHPGLNRDGCRTPMQWDSTTAAGFSTNPDPWLPVNSDFATRNVETELDDPASILSLHRALLSYRRAHAVLQEGDLHILPIVNDSLFAFERRLGGDSRTIVLSTSDEPQSVPDISGWVALSSDPERRAGNAFDGVLQSHEAVLLEPSTGPTVTS